MFLLKISMYKCNSLKSSTESNKVGFNKTIILPNVLIQAKTIAIVKAKQIKKHCTILVEDIVNVYGCCYYIMHLKWLDRNYLLNKMWYSGSSLNETSHFLLCLTWGKKHGSLSIIICVRHIYIYAHPITSSLPYCTGLLVLWIFLSKNCCTAHTFNKF